MAGARGAGRGAGPGGAGASVGAAAANALFGSLYARPAGAGGGRGSGAAVPPVRLLQSKLGRPLISSWDHTHNVAVCGDAVADKRALMRACGALRQKDSRAGTHTGQAGYTLNGTVHIPCARPHVPAMKFLATTVHGAQQGESAGKRACIAGILFMRVWPEALAVLCRGPTRASLRRRASRARARWA